MAAGRGLTELEGCVLGLIWEKGPCTPYALRREFLRSPSPHWSGSAGTIYPLVARLAQQGLLRPRNSATGHRQSKHYVLTAAGLRRLVLWLTPPLPEEVVGIPPDPLRTRVRFLGALPPARRAALLADAEARLVAHLEQLRKDGADHCGPKELYYSLMSRGAITMMAVRLTWLRTVLSTTAERPGYPR